MRRKIFAVTLMFLLALFITSGFWWNSATDGDGNVNTPLHTAAREGNLQSVVTLIAGGADVNAENRGRQTPLDVSLYLDDLRVTQYLVENGADLDRPGLLRAAVFSGTTETVRLFLEAGINPDRISDGLFGFGPRGDLEALELLLDAGADINAVDTNGRTPLYDALPYAEPEIIQRMIASGADVTQPDGAGRTPLQFLSGRNHPAADIIAILVDAGADPNRSDPGGSTPLHRAATSEAAENVVALVGAGADIESRNADNATPLLAALRAGHLASVRALLDFGARTDVTGFAGRNALFFAASSESPEVMELILSGVTVVDPRDDDGATPLMVASATGPVALIAAGADVNAADDDGWTPLHFAARYGDGAIVRFLIVQGADPAAVESEGRRPWRMGFNNRALRADPGAFDLLDVD